jgi:hypothetical protein
MYSGDTGFNSRMSLSFSWFSVLTSSLKINYESIFPDRLSMRMVLCGYKRIKRADKKVHLVNDMLRKGICI